MAAKDQQANIKPILYTYYRSSCSWRVRIALALKGIEYESIPVHLVKDGGEQHKEEYLSINPAAKIPTLIIDGHTLTQSLAIIEYIDETRGGHSLLPPDAYGKATVRMICETIASDIQPIQNLSVLQKVGNENKAEWGNYWITRGFNILEKLLIETAGKYCYKDDITMADICLIPQIYNANRFKVDMSVYPNITRISAELNNHPSFIASHASKQPDCPEEI